MLFQCRTFLFGMLLRADARRFSRELSLGQSDISPERRVLVSRKIPSCTTGAQIRFGRYSRGNTGSAVCVCLSLYLSLSVCVCCLGFVRRRWDSFSRFPSLPRTFSLSHSLVRDIETNILINAETKSSRRRRSERVSRGDKRRRFTARPMIYDDPGKFRLSM